MTAANDCVRIDKTSGIPVRLYQRAAAHAEGLTAIDLEAANAHASSPVTCQSGRGFFNTPSSVSTLPQPHASPHTSLFVPRCFPHAPVTGAFSQPFIHSGFII